jgi:hypothetical protein
MRTSFAADVNSTKSLFENPPGGGTGLQGNRLSREFVGRVPSRGVGVEFSNRL